MWMEVEAIRKAAEKIGNLEVMLSKRLFIDWGNLTHDDNPVHRDDKAAQEAGFGWTEAIAQGVLLQAFAEKYLIEILRRADVNDKCVGYSFKFSKPAYAGKVVFSSDKFREGGFVIRAVNRDGNAAFDSNVRLVDEYPILKDKTDGEIFSVIPITRQEKDLFYRYLWTFGDNPSYIHVASLIPAVLLTAAGQPKAAYRSVDLTFHNKPKVGDFEVKLDRQNSRPLGEFNIYDFRGIVYQEGRPIVSEKLSVISKQIALQTGKIEVV